MLQRIHVALALVTMVGLCTAAPACCPAPPGGKPVVNADQTVIMIWDAAAKTQHFIRQASFKSDAADFGFLVPSPSEPQLDESGNEAFELLRKLTEPERIKKKRPTNVSCGCSGKHGASRDQGVVVLQEKLVAGFQAAVLEAKSADALIDWLKDHGYAYSPEIQAWAKPYVEQGWKITALKVAKKESDRQDKSVHASALRISFQTDKPLFPYREPDSTTSARALNATNRLLRIYFIGDGRYDGGLLEGARWTGTPAWANKISPEDRKKILESLKLPENTGSADWWMTEFEDDWPYKSAPSDLYFSRSAKQDPLKREPIIEYTASAWPNDVTILGLGALIFGPFAWRWARRQRSAQP